jgi:hypothetical protein
MVMLGRLVPTHLHDVSTVGKRNSAGQRQRRQNGPCNSINSLQRQECARELRQCGALRKKPGNLCLHRTAWWGWEDSNF